ncbi:MAG TPA: glycoside hydrolase family 13 protein [Bacteroidales bacterium]|nr:glycoside hydrolase family 13 protein [Bacteroidales bacterium]
MKQIRLHDNLNKHDHEMVAATSFRLKIMDLKQTAKLILVSLAIFIVQHAWGQTTDIKRLEPSSWWIGMYNPELMLMAYGNQIGLTEPQINIPGVVVTEVKKVDNPNYLFIFLRIDSTARPGKYTITFVDKKRKQVRTPFTLFQRTSRIEGFNQSDAIYLIMPDRFANGDTTNDNVAGMRERCNRQEPFGCHGGDLQGIINHLDYIQSVGMTALWLTPVLENNQQHSSYHGYSITDYYRVDPRLGSNELYRKLAEECHKRGMKLIMDMVFNHCGSFHWWMNDLPTPDWIHQFPTYTSSNYRPSVMSDPHAAQADVFKNTHGWFDRTMPDMNLSNPLVLTYLIQNSLWWIEYLHLDGILVDTYPYPEKEGMSKWMQVLAKEYPKLNIVGEVWTTNNAQLSYWQKDAPNRDGFNTHLPTLMDFPLTDAIQRALNEEDGYDRGLARIYYAIAEDFLYPYPNNKVIFAENHDWARIFEFLGKDLNKMKIAITLVATLRGIPQFYYGSEILMTGNGWQSHAEIRKDFPGGWPTDTVNAFTPEGRTAEQNEMVNYVSKLFNYRKTHPVLQNGKMIHFVPENSTYVYFRMDDTSAVMVAINNHPTETRKLDVERMKEILSHYHRGKDILTQEEFNDFLSIDLSPKSCRVIELK